MGKYKRYLKRHMICFVLAPLFMVMEACGEFILPYINANIINVGAANGDVPYIIENGLIMAGIAVVMLVSGVLGGNFAIRGAARLAAGVRGDVFRQVQRFAFSDIDAFSTGSLITRLTNDINQIQNFTQTCLRGMFRSPVMIIGALVMSFLLNKTLAWAILIVVVLLASAIALIIRTASPRYTAMQQQLDLLNNGLGETIAGERVIKSFVREEHEKLRFSVINDALMQKSTAALKLMLLLQPVSALAINVTTLCVVWLAGRQIMVGSMELGTLTAFITYLTQVLSGLDFVANIVLQGTRAAASDRRLGEVLRTQPAIADSAAALEGDKAVRSGEIELKNVSFRYMKHSKVLDNVSLHIRAGELVGIVGSTGSGKTTLVSLIPRLYEPEAGEVLVGGVNVRDLPLGVLRSSVAMVLQKNTLFSGTIAENLRWGNPEATDEEIAHAAQLAQADGFVRGFPKGYDTELGRGGVNLSGGQKQRLCIARALLKKPKILILDDSTSAVDTATDACIRRALREELPGVTKLIIAQRITSIADADTIIVMDGGRIVDCGRHEELLQRCATYAEICDSQRDREEARHE
ncbi:MAG: ABC transporter ATP-binding protein [Clostridia bacterium]|nr:ABC transporter ATP-binding protein [Clostridia bacterium]